MTSARPSWPVLLCAAALFVLPFPGSVSIRLACFIVAFGAAVYLWRRLEVPAVPIKAAIAAWAAIAIASALYAFDTAYTIGEIKNEVGYSLIAFLALFALTTDERRLRLALGAVAAGLAVMAVAAIGGFLLGRGWPLGAWYGEPAPATHYILIASPAAALGAWLHLPRHRVAALGAILAVTLALSVLSGQRAIWLALGIQAAFAFAWLWTRGAFASARIRIVALVLLVAVPLAGLYLTDRLRVRMEPMAALEHDLRAAVWSKVAQRINDKPLTGAGFGRRVLEKAHPDLIPAENRLFWHAHNTVLNYGLSAGYPGMLAILALFAAFGARFWRLAREPDAALATIGLAGTAIVAGVFSRNLFNDFFVRDGALLFWAVAGALLGYALRRERSALSAGEPALART